MCTSRSILDRVATAVPLEGNDGRSGATLERAMLTDGSSLILKHVTPERDYIMRATRDTGRLPAMWDNGAFTEISRHVDPGMVAVERESDGWLIAMPDVGDSLLADDRLLTRAESKRVLSAVGDMHRAFAGRPLDGLCDLRDRFRVFAPEALNADRNQAYPFGISTVVRRGWRLFGDLVPTTVARAIAAVHADPSGLASELEKLPSTLIHGDLRLANVGLYPDRVVLLDWGSTCSYAPSALEFSWYLIISASRIDASREQVVADFREVEGAAFNERALHLANIGALALLGWNKAFDIESNPDPAIRERETEDLEWWCDAVSEALQVWSPV